MNSVFLPIVLKTIEAFPNGRTTQELYALLDIDFDANKRAAIRAELAALSHQGLIRLGRDGKWRLVSRLPRAEVKDSVSSPGFATRPDRDHLVAVPARFRTVQADNLDPAQAEEECAETPDPRALLRYYRAAIRTDPRGALTQVFDKYGTTYVLLTGSGNIWPLEDGDQGEVRIQLDLLPDTFREALTRREANENGLAIGWPVSIDEKQGVPVVRPVGLIAGEWLRAGNELVVSIPHSDILVNPDWVRASARRSAWRAGDLAAVFRATEGVGLSKEDFSERLREAQASAIRGRLTGSQFVAQLDAGQSGIHNALGLFLPTETTFTRGAVRDLDQMATWTDDQLAQTALAPFLGVQSAASFPNTDPINIGPINAEQFDAIRFTMSRALTVVTGPPGTGKSQAIVSMAATALQNGETVLVASKNHQALDAVEERLASIAPEARFLVRTLDPTKGIDKTVKDILKEIIDDGNAAVTVVDPFLEARLGQIAHARTHAMDLLAERRRLNLELADLIERLELRVAAETADQSIPRNPERPRVSWLRRILRALRLVRRAAIRADARDGSGVLSRRDIETAINRLRKALDGLEEPADVCALTDNIAELARSVVVRTLADRSSIDTETKDCFRSVVDDLELQGHDELSRQIIDNVVARRPLWLASVLGTPKRIPLHRGLFDLVIFDEASQCDIGTSLPLLVRARRAVVVGDDRQLAFIPQIGAAQDRNLMAAQGLPNRGMGRFAQGRKSLFDLAASTSGAQRIMLRDQYRSAPDIVEYISKGFYGGKLRASADPAGFRTPTGAPPGLAWTDVPGQGDPAVQGNVNRAEIAAIVDHLEELLLVQNYDGSVGVIAPFRAQVGALEQALMARLGASAFQQSDLRIATVDGFQGQERDLILFSPVVHAASPPSAVTFLQRDWRRLNVAISRARAVCHVFGDLSFAKSRKIRSLATLADRATGSRARIDGEGVFDSHWERIVYHALCDRGLDPKPQHEVAGHRLDFALFSGDIKLDLEVDGRRWHEDTDGNRKSDDIWRDQQLKALGWRVRRFWVDELSRNLEKCLDLVEQDLV